MAFWLHVVEIRPSFIVTLLCVVGAIHPSEDARGHQWDDKGGFCRRDCHDASETVSSSLWRGYVISVKNVYDQNPLIGAKSLFKWHSLRLQRTPVWVSEVSINLQLGYLPVHLLPSQCGVKAVFAATLCQFGIIASSLWVFLRFVAVLPSQSLLRAGSDKHLSILINIYPSLSILLYLIVVIACFCWTVLPQKYWKKHGLIRVTFTRSIVIVSFHSKIT